MMAFAGRAAIVTGAARGIGKAVALQLAAVGMDVLACSRSERNDAELPGTIGETAKAVSALGRKGIPMRVDLPDDSDNRAMVARALEEFGRIDLLVNNAAYAAYGSLLDSPIGEFDRSFRVNARAPYLSTQLVAPSMIEHGGGVIFNITSGAAKHPRALSPAAAAASRGMTMFPNATYGSTKAALDRCTSALAPELHKHNIAIVALNPGFTNTERTRSLALPDFEMAGSQSPGSIGTIITFIAADPMAYTGQIIDAREFAQAHGL